MEATAVQFILEHSKVSSLDIILEELQIILTRNMIILIRTPMK